MKKPNFKHHLATISVITMVAMLPVLALTQSAILASHSASAAKEQSSSHDNDCLQNGPGHVDHNKDNCDRNGNNNEREDKGNGKDNSNDV
jgi:hypothetical protein